MEATFSFTIPSIHDGNTLDCRVYLPARPKWDDSSRCAGLVGAIVAHPYALLGGCYDDHVVLAVVKELLKQGCFVGTFNFRGVYGSNGHTSWTGKPEIQDYISFAGFLIHYLDSIRHFAPPNASTQAAPSNLSPTSAAYLPSPSSWDARPEVKLIFGGYSYGSIIVSRLPCLREILSHFRNSEDKSPVAEILQRARTISGWTSPKLEGGLQENVCQSKHVRPRSPSITMGGEETLDQSRISKDGGRKSVDLDGLKKSLDIARRVKERKSHIRSREDTKFYDDEENDDDYGISSIKAQYLMISPVLGLVGSALSAFDNPSEAEDMKMTLAKEPTIVLYGDKDVFTSARKVRQWTQKLISKSDLVFAVEVNGAGHFWQEHGAIERMCNAVGLWVKDLRTAPK